MKLLCLLLPLLTSCVVVRTPRTHAYIPADFSKYYVKDGDIEIVLDGVRMTELARERWQGATQALQTGALTPMLMR